MGELRITVDGFHCEKCGHNWIPRSEKLRPAICPKCKSARWNEK